MKLTISKSKNTTHYYVTESYRKGQRVMTRRIKKIGEYSQMLNDGIKDPLQFVKDEIKRLNEEKKKDKLEISQIIDFTEKLASVAVESKGTLSNVGWYYLESLYDKFELNEVFDNIKTRVHYDLVDIFKMLVIERILEPQSKRRTIENLSKYLNAERYSLNDAYRCLDIINKQSDQIQKQLFLKTSEIIPINTSILYYDCTNFYFETEDEDDNIYDDDGDIIQWGLRRYGASKEHRPNPIVQMGLFTEMNGIPISYCIHHGSMNEQLTTIPLERRMIEEYKTSKFIYCSDGGLGSFDNRFYNTLNNREYVVTQSLKKTEKKELDLIFKDLNWKTVDDDQPISLNKFKAILDKKFDGIELSDEEQEYIKCETIYKTFPMKRKIQAKFLKQFNIDLSKNVLSMNETLFITFSAKYYLYQRQLLERQLETANCWLNRDPDSIRKGPNDIRRLIKTYSTTEEGELASEKLNIIDENQVKKEKQFHGFYAVATSLNTNVKAIMQINASRWKIEQSFRILKSEFDARPTFVWTENHIKAHFCICYVALLMYRILERQLHLLDKENNHFSCQQILGTLKAMNVKQSFNCYYEACYTGSKILNALEQVYNLGLNHKYYSIDRFKRRNCKENTNLQVATNLDQN